MGCLVGAIIAIFIGIGMAVVLSPFIFMSLSRAKKEARNIIAVGMITDIQKTNKIMKILAGMITDIEAKDLWQKLQALKDKQHSLN
jgi:hypothetical protein